MDTQKYTPEERMQIIMDALVNGATVGDVYHVSDQDLEAGYALAYNLYNAGNYKDSETMFAGLTLYKHTDKRFWMGLGGSRQMLKKYREAADAYGMATVLGLDDPAPSVHAGICFLKMGDKENALNAFTGATCLGDAENPTHQAYKQKANAMIELLQDEKA